MSIDFTKFPFNFKLHLKSYINYVLRLGEEPHEQIGQRR